MSLLLVRIMGWGWVFFFSRGLVNACRLGARQRKASGGDLRGMTDPAVQESHSNLRVSDANHTKLYMDFIEISTIAVLEGERVKKREQDVGYGKKRCIGKRWYTEGRMQGEVSAT